MTFNPTTHDLELIAELAVAWAPTAKIASELGITEAEFKAWCQRLAAARMMMATMPEFPAKAARGAAVQPAPGSGTFAEVAEALAGATLRSKIVADRLFSKP